MLHTVFYLVFYYSEAKEDITFYMDDREKLKKAANCKRFLFVRVNDASDIRQACIEEGKNDNDDDM